MTKIISSAQQREEQRGGGGEGGGGREVVEELRWRVNQLEKDKVELNSAHNQEMCGVLAQLARLRSAVERGEAERQTVELQLAVSRRDAARAAELRRDNEALNGNIAVSTRQRREPAAARAAAGHTHTHTHTHTHIHFRFCFRFIKYKRVCVSPQEQQEALEELERRVSEVEKEREKEAEANRRQAGELKHLTEREERSRREKEVSEERVKSLQSGIEAERAAHLESKFNSEIIQVTHTHTHTHTHTLLISQRITCSQFSLKIFQLRFIFIYYYTLLNMLKKRGLINRRMTCKQYEQIKAKLIDSQLNNIHE
uniref:Uncharacterized protein n=1 Tax=Myripristis murdjan TaxID=586833 RepID=A0A667WDF3_9TELE